MKLEVWAGKRLIGWLGFDDATARYAFRYAPDWLTWIERFALSPQLPLTDAPPQSLEAHSVVVRQFFENLLPEGRLLEEVAASLRISKTNVAGVLASIGRETAGALRIAIEGSVPTSGAPREVSTDELSQRIRERPEMPFSSWDGRVRLSIAGYQDKLAVIENGERWSLPDGEASSTHILKIDPKGQEQLNLTSNEFITMRLAAAAGLAAAPVRLRRIPEPVLVVERFDRRCAANGEVERIHIIDGCQALGLPAAFKYERQHGHGEHVAHMRDGASLPKFFALLIPGVATQPAADRQRLLRWVIFQALVGNSDAHAKNLSFFSSYGGLALAPAYDLVSVLALPTEAIELQWAMAIGDAFDLESLNAEEWLEFEITCGVLLRFVNKELVQMCRRVLKVVEEVARQCIEEGADADTADAIVKLINKRAEPLIASLRIPGA